MVLLKLLKETGLTKGKKKKAKKALFSPISLYFKMKPNSNGRVEVHQTVTIHLVLSGVHLQSGAEDVHWHSNRSSQAGQQTA